DDVGLPDAEVGFPPDELVGPRLAVELPLEDDLPPLPVEPLPASERGPPSEQLAPVATRKSAPNPIDAQSSRRKARIRTSPRATVRPCRLHVGDPGRSPHVEGCPANPKRLPRPPARVNHASGPAPLFSN